MTSSKDKAAENAPMSDEESAAWMQALLSEKKARALNLVLRLSSMGSKLLLTLFMGKFFDLSAIGAYGLVFGVVMLANAFLGQHLAFIVSREIVGVAPSKALGKIRDMSLWYGINFAGFCILAAICVWTGATTIPVEYIGFVLVISLFENLGSMCYETMNALNQQLWANFTLFIRAAGWVPFVIILGLLDDRFLSEKTVLFSWMVGSGLSLLIPLWLWSKWGWRAAMRKPIDWFWIKGGVKKCSILWLGGLSLVAGGYVDRYVVSTYLNLDFVGVMTFYYSFVNVFYPLIESGIMAFASPRLVLLHKEKQEEEFWRFSFKTVMEIVLGGGLFVLLLSGFVPLLAFLLDRAAFLSNIGVFWLLLVGAWLQGTSLGFTNILYARHHDRPIWMGQLCFLATSIAGNFLFVPTYGFIGIGYSAIAASIVWLVWNVKAVKWPKMAISSLINGK